MTTDAQSAEPTRCEWCGADYDPSAPPPQPPKGHTPTAPAPGDEPVTHCEWCGAEYPVPGGTPEGRPG